MPNPEQPSVDISLIEKDKSRIIEMAWEDRTTFDAIKTLYGLDESALMLLMKRWLSFGSYRLWRKRVKTKSSKHQNLRSASITRAYCPTQYKLGR